MRRSVEGSDGIDNNFSQAYIKNYKKIHLVFGIYHNNIFIISNNYYISLLFLTDML